ncbi:MAG: DUF2147 domain-containing protein [Scytonema sp. PMC 1069.18]|nr:DUF2147 domain-containing protein [Scytonema sp. PMC 1069.18]MEC4884344.1 DUF2147 domain-containing protein [Scytonema sp. PMC 1070.18]
MNTKKQALYLAISVTSLLYSNVFATPLVANAETPKLPVSTQLIAQQSVSSNSSIEGIWEAQGKYRIQISQNNGVYNGKIIWIAPGAEKKDVKNPDKKLRPRDLIGVEMLTGFKYNADKKQWIGGKIYAPAAGKTLNAKLSITNKNELQVKVSMGIMSKTMTLKPVQQ